MFGFLRNYRSGKCYDMEIIVAEIIEIELDMGFLVTTLIFLVVGIIASLCTRICCNRGPSANLCVYFFSQHHFFSFLFWVWVWLDDFYPVLHRIPWIANCFLTSVFECIIKLTLMFVCPGCVSSNNPILTIVVLTISRRDGFCYYMGFWMKEPHLELIYYRR